MAPPTLARRPVMMAGPDPGSRAAAWLAALEPRYLADLTRQEVARALRALSSCYVERRGGLTRGAALEGAGKRAAFAVFYSPLHFLTVAGILDGLAPAPAHAVLDLGCGAGAAGGAWALRTGARVVGSDRSAWAVGEATWTYRQLGLLGRATQGDALRVRPESSRGAIVAAYFVNELSDAGRLALLPRLLAAGRRGQAVLVVEPIARRVSPWWPSWRDAFLAAGGRDDEWRFPAEVPSLQRDLARAAGLDLRELTARSLHLAGAPAPGRATAPIG